MSAVKQNEIRKFQCRYHTGSTAGNGLRARRVRVNAFDDLVAALKMYRDSGYGRLFHRASKEARAASLQELA